MHTHLSRLFLLVAAAALLTAACGDVDSSDTPGDGPDAGVDATGDDTGTSDAGTPNPDTGAPDPDTGAPAPDTGTPDPDTGGPDPDTGAPDPDTGGTIGTSLDPDLFDILELVDDFSVVDCTLSDGSSSTCHRVVVRNVPAEWGPGCPANIDDVGGVGFYDPDGVPELYALDRALWELMESDGFDIVDASGNVNVNGPGPVGRDRRGSSSRLVAPRRDPRTRSSPGTAL